MELNEHDQGNLNFLLNISEETFNDWIEQIDLDDVNYALELLQNHSSMLELRRLESLDEVHDASEVAELLKKFK